MYGNFSPPVSLSPLRGYACNVCALYPLGTKQLYTRCRQNVVVSIRSYITSLWSVQPNGYLA